MCSGICNRPEFKWGYIIKAMASHCMMGIPDVRQQKVERYKDVGHLWRWILHLAFFKFKFKHTHLVENGV
jgi:hypothetical protein